MDLQERKEIARYLLSKDDVFQRELEAIETLSNISPCARFDFDYPDRLKPTPLPIKPKPNKSKALPKVDVVVVTWTVAEAKALADIFTCPFRPNRSTPSANNWYGYNRNFQTKFKGQIRRGAPSRKTSLLGSYFICTINAKKILCFKSELHLNQDGIRTGNGTATLPVRELFQQILKETEAKHIFTTGTCGATNRRHGLGDVVATRSAKFRLADEFKNEPFNHKIFKSNWNIPAKFFDHAEHFMQVNMEGFHEPGMLPPTEKYQYNGDPIITKQNRPNIYLEGLKLPSTSPILTTDYFEFGNSTSNNLSREGCGVEMGDAVLGLVCSELGNRAPKWAVIRNLSDPVINGNLREDASASLGPRIALQTMWAVWYYETYGYWTSINSALTTWALIAGI
jgi:nucleoside phosphorylase